MSLHRRGQPLPLHLPAGEVGEQQQLAAAQTHLKLKKNPYQQAHQSTALSAVTRFAQVCRAMMEMRVFRRNRQHDDDNQYLPLHYTIQKSAVIPFLLTMFHTI